jgi:steryl-sulfatase
MHTYLATSGEFAKTTRHGRYGDAVEELDWGIGELTKTLDRLGFLNNTLIYFTSDNGGHLEEVNHKGELEGGYNGIYRGMNYELLQSDYKPTSYNTKACLAL